MDIFICATISSLLLAVEHFFPWRKVIRQDLPRLVAYVLGTLAICVPLVALCLMWGDRYPASAVALAIVVTVVSSGLTVFGCYGLDWAINRFAQVWAEREINNVAR